MDRSALMIAWFVARHRYSLWLARQRLFLRLEKGTSESERVRNARHGLKRVAATGNDYRAEVEHPPQHALLDLHALDLRDVELDRLAAHEAELGDHPLVGDREFGRAVLEPGWNEQEQPDHNRRQQHTKEDLRKHRPQADAAEVQHSFALDEGFFDVAGHLGGGRRGDDRRCCAVRSPASIDSDSATSIHSGSDRAYAAAKRGCADAM